ncbi:YheT family hydrolase [Anabaena sp. 4-3]|uniref:YheT family hydrolase n=1 Tax=Anabaena sp. 4-3 TaxID=1811979 RepID=UPI00082A1B2E|nr:alpha/beta fold hydrolase [Anabaena sp. 4-3]
MMCYFPYKPAWFLENGAIATVYTALWGQRYWQNTIPHPEPLYKKTVLMGGQNVPIHTWIAIPENAHSTIVGTYGITGELDSNWLLRSLATKAYAQGFAVVLFDWRGHGKTAELSPTLMSDGLFEGEDFVRMAAATAAMGCPRKFWFTGFSLGGQLALWGLKKAADLTKDNEYFGLRYSDIAGGVVLCPNLDKMRSLKYLVSYPFGRYLDSVIVKSLKKLAWQIHDTHSGSLDPAAIQRVNSIWDFDAELVIPKLGFPSVEAYYKASNALQLLPEISKPTLIIYAADDPFFPPDIIPDLQAACGSNPMLDLILTRHGGHLAYMSSKKNQQQAQDPDPWWAWNRVLQWLKYMISLN